MIEAKQIRVERRRVELPSGRVEYHVAAELSIDNVQLVPREEANADAFARAEYYARDAVWRELYGDLLAIVEELRSHVHYLDAMNGVTLRAVELVDALRAKIARPGSAVAQKSGPSTPRMDAEGPVVSEELRG